jgi:hypothetical protein
MWSSELCSGGFGVEIGPGGRNCRRRSLCKMVGVLVLLLRLLLWVQMQALILEEK